MDTYYILVAGAKRDSVQQSVSVGHAVDTHHQTAYFVKYAWTFTSMLCL
jgi:hypothetical protein